MADTNKKYRERRRLAEKYYRNDVGFFARRGIHPEDAIESEELKEYAYPVELRRSYRVLTTWEKVWEEHRTYMTTHNVRHDIMANITQERYYELEEKAREEHIRYHYTDSGASKNYGRSEKGYRKTYNRRRRRLNKRLCHEYLYEGESSRTAKIEGKIESCGYGIAWDMW